MNNKIWCILFWLLSLICFFALVDMLIFTTYKNTAKAHILSFKKEDNKNSKVNFYYINNRGDSINVTKTKKKKIAEKFIQSTSQKIYYSPIFKYQIRFFNERFDYTGFILISICFILFLFTAFQYTDSFKK